MACTGWPGVGAGVLQTVLASSSSNFSAPGALASTTRQPAVDSTSGAFAVGRATGTGATARNSANSLIAGHTGASSTTRRTRRAAKDARREAKHLAATARREAKLAKAQVT